VKGGIWPDDHVIANEHSTGAAHVTKVTYRAITSESQSFTDPGNGTRAGDRYESTQLGALGKGDPSA